MLQSLFVLFFYHTIVCYLKDELQNKSTNQLNIYEYLIIYLINQSINSRVFPDELRIAMKFTWNKKL